MKREYTRRFKFCAGHRIFGYDNECSHVHGHNYVLAATARAHLNSEFFETFGQKIRDWIDTMWDHKMILFDQDPLVVEWQRGKLMGNEYCLLPFNPTAENMAHYILNHVCPLLFHGMDVGIIKVVLWETENCYATAEKFEFPSGGLA